MNKREILRYLGAAPDTEQLDDLIAKAEREVTAAAVPRHVFQRLPVMVRSNAVTVGGTELVSRDLAAHLQGCSEVFLFAMTLGAGIDSLIRRYSLTEMPLVPVLQACSAAYTEECADVAQREIEQIARAENLYLRPRYSPGYGDFKLEYQKFLFAALDISKKIGVSLTDDCLMIPFKSVTAIIGLSPDPSLCHVGKCMTCTAADCPFRKEEQA